MKEKYGLKPVFRIKEMLEELNLTQKDLAEMMGETPQQLNKWVSGVEPSISALCRICLTLNITLSHIIWLKGDDPLFTKDKQVFIRGEVANTLAPLANGPDQGEKFLAKLREYYRWTDAEFDGLRAPHWITGKPHPETGLPTVIEVCLQGSSDAFVAWAKKDRDDMYRM